jgi:serine/threonine-protein kinase
LTFADQALVGQLIADRYRVLKKIGEGGMGEVYLAEHIYIEKRVALKLLRAEVLSNQEAVVRFRQEARSASSIGHDNIIQIDDFGTLPDGRIYMAMEFLSGSPLNELIARQPLPLPRALDILIQTTKGLAAAHAKGITHRDMKPENIFVINKDGRDLPKILDFGIAKVSGNDAQQNLTVAGSIFGTPFYMAPEQAMGAKMDHRVDIYAMGIILYEVFCGQVPFKAESFMGILTQHITSEPMPPSQMAAHNGRMCPPELEAIILRAVRKDPNQRYQSMAELTNALIDFVRYAVGPEVANQYYPARGSSSMPIAYQHQPQKPPTPGNRRLLVFGGIGAAVVALGITIAVVAAKGGGEPPKHGADAGVVKPPTMPDAARPAQTPPDAPHQAVTTPDAPGAVVTTTPDAPPAVVEGEQVEVTAVPRAWVYDENGKELGRTPLTVIVPPGKKRYLELRASGHVATPLTLDGTRKRIEKKLLNTDLHGPE